MGTVQIDGSTPKITVGNATAEDATILFDGNAQDFYIALDDSADDLLIGLGSTVGTTPIISMDENKKVSLAADLDVTTVATAATFEPDGDTAAGDNAAIGYTASEGLILTGQGSTDDVTIKNDADATVLQVATGTTNVEITAGNLVIGTSGKGIDFSATADSSGSMASELLDDYEEGTFDATLTDSSGGMTVTMNADYTDMKYTKIGDICHIGGSLVVSSVSGSLTGYIGFTLPFTVKDTADSSGKWSVPVAIYDVDFPTANQYGAFMSAGEGGATAFFYTWGEDSSGGKMNLTSSSQLYLSFSFPTA